MPVRTFHCVQCDLSWNRLLAVSISTDICSKCAAVCAYVFGTSSDVQITERINNYWNKSLPTGHKEKMEKRSREHMREHEIHDMIAKFGIDTLKNHPLIKDGRVRRKDE